MRNMIVGLMTMLAALAVSAPAMAFPTAYYNPATGNLRLVNDQWFLGVSQIW